MTSLIYVRRVKINGPSIITLVFGIAKSDKTQHDNRRDMYNAQFDKR